METTHDHWFHRASNNILHKYFTAVLLSVLLPACIFADGTQGGRSTDIVVSNGHIRLLFETVPGRSYQLQQIPNVTGRWWDDEGSTVVATETTTVSHVTNDASCAFFRVLEFTNSVFWYDWTYLYQDPYLSSWGLGVSEESYHHQDRSCEWYIDQADTGAASANNCGPSSVTMAIKWYDRSFAKTAEDARNWSYDWRGNGWWFTTDIIDYLDLHSVPNTTSSYTDTDQLQGLVSVGKLLILCVDTGYLTQNANSTQRIDRFYSYAGGHFIVVKGARSVSGSLLLEVYDPNNWHAAYIDGTPKGRNRHFRGDELTQAISNWWDYIIVVDAPADGGGGKTLQQSSHWLKPVDPSTIEHACGK